MFATNAATPPLIIELVVKYCSMKNANNGKITIKAVKNINF